jgi:hypothetical protein
MRAIASGLAILLTACAANVPAVGILMSEEPGLCPRLTSFAKSVPPGEERSVTLTGEGLLGTQTCERGDAAFNPGGVALCEWWVTNSFREFFGENFRDVADCLTNGQKISSPDELRYEAAEPGHLHSGHLALKSVGNIDRDLAVNVAFNAPETTDGGEPVDGLKITFRRVTRR